ncbi:MAG: hypothetical protein JRN21_09970 [Nitrososphaerota archaeon]|nr:hypothetical protein [Nitrososphaerota archaeon]
MQRKVAISSDGSHDSRPADLKKATFRLPPALLKAVQHYAVDHDMSDQTVFIEALKAYLQLPTKDKENGAKKI